MAHLTTVNLEQRLAVLDDGRSVPVTNLIDRFGDDTNDPAEAVGFVAGAGREWFADSVAEYSDVAVQ